MPPMGRDLSQRGEDEAAFVQPRVRQNQCRALPYLTIVIEKIEVEDARGVALAPDPTKPPFDGLQHAQQLARAEFCRQRRYRIDEPRLVGGRYRLAAIPSRTSMDAYALCFQPGKRRSQRISRRAELGASQIPADTDQDHLLARPFLCLT